MNVNEVFDGVERLWQELSVIVVIHSVALAFAVVGGLLTWHGLITTLTSSRNFTELSALRTALDRFGLELPFVVGTAVVVYVILFQKLSASLTKWPICRLSYSQIALWRAGKCFDELRQLIRWFEGYTASTALTDLEVTLELAIAQTAKDYKEHFDDLIGNPQKGAAMWSRYYTGFLLLAVVLVFLSYRLSLGPKSVLAPGALIVAAMISKCGWEAQVEHIVTGRLQFVTDCGIILGMKRREQDMEVRHRDGRANLENRVRGTSYAELQQGSPVYSIPLEDERQLAADLMKLPPPGFPYQELWLLHILRRLLPFAKLGTLSLIRNDVFRSWLHECKVLQPRATYETAELAHLRGEALLKSFELPEFATETNRLTKLLLNRLALPISSVLFPRTLLVDDMTRYRDGSPCGEFELMTSGPRLSLNKWISLRSRFPHRSIGRQKLD
jgi:hypothetical protein